MRREIESILKAFETGDPRANHDWGSDLWMLMEWSVRPHEDREFYRAIIGDALMKRRLSKPEQREVVRRLLPCVRRVERGGSAATILCAAPSQYVLRSLLKVIAERWVEFDDNTKHQCLVAIREHMRYGPDGFPRKRFLKAVRDFNPRAKVVAAQRSNDRCLRQMARNILPTLDKYLSGRRLKAQ